MRLQQPHKMAGHKLLEWTAVHSVTLQKRIVSQRKLGRCQAHASTRPARKSRNPVARPSPKSDKKPGSPTKPQRPNWQTSRQSDEAADLALIRQQKATNASKKVRSVSGLQRAAALQGLSPTVKPFSVALAAYKVEVDEQQGKKGRGRGMKQASTHTLLQAYRASFTAALEAEHTEEWQLAEQRLLTWAPQRLQDEGMALLNLSASPDGALYKDSITRFWGPKPQGLPYHVLSHGDIVLISRHAPGDDAVEGVVMDFSSQWIRVAVPQAVAGHFQGQPWRLDLYANATAHERCMAAVQRFTDPTASAASEESKGLQRVLLGAGIEAALRAAAQQSPRWVEGSAGQGRLKTALAALQETTHAPGGVNFSQAAAIKAALTQTLTLWQGPPGTGKTFTLLHFLRLATLVLPKGEGSQIIASAATNVAVDGLVMGLMKHGVKVVRMGQPARVSPAVQGVTLEALVAGHPAGRAAALLQQRAYKLKGKEGMALRMRATSLEDQAADELLAGAQVVAATCVGAEDSRLAGRTFKLCALDEASQATEPASLIPLLRNCEAAVLVGDPCQLPPTVVSLRAGEAGLGVSMMERLQAAGVTVQMLQTQYRMHPVLASWPSSTFYGNQLLSHPTPAERKPPQGFPWPVPGLPIAFLDCSGQERRTALNSSSTAGTAGTSYQNDEEATTVLKVLQQLLSGSGALQTKDIGVITPYTGQVRAIKAALEQHRPKLATGQLDVKSVDGFQGAACFRGVLHGRLRIRRLADCKAWQISHTWLVTRLILEVNQEHSNRGLNPQPEQ
ncbi:hypothetical protein ABBQ32_14194 [Trebouxia sp. C0010 RCD-2024]